MFVALLTLLITAAPADGPDTLVVCPVEFREALEPWLRYRDKQGHHIVVVANDRSAVGIRKTIREVAESGSLKQVVLVGDADPAAAHDLNVRRRSVPSHLAKAKVNVQWGSEPEIATDNWYADLDDDIVPDLAIGRLTADTSDELTQMISKIMSYEQQSAQGMWRRRVNFVAGVGGFGKVVDSVLEMATKKFLTEGIPASYCTSMTYGSWQSPFCPDPRRFHQQSMDRFNEGCLFWVYIGHGQRHYLDRVRVPGGHHHIMSNEDADLLRSAEGSPIAIFLACYTGAFDDRRDCLAEEMLSRTGGPVGVVCGSRVTMPYAMAVMSNEMMDQYFNHRCETLGEVVFKAKRKLAIDDKEDSDGQNETRQTLDAIARVISPSPKLLHEERAEHLLLFNLLGDPLLRLHHPNKVQVDVAKQVLAGDKIKVSGTSQVHGKCTVELVCRRDRTTFTPPVRRQYDPSDESLTEYTNVYERANDRCWASTSANTKAENFETELHIPEEAYGPCHIRVFVDGTDNYAMGSTAVFVKKADN